MKPYYEDKWVTQYCSDALTILRQLESDSVDLLCTDPPYGIGFMGKDWDKALPDKEIWAECLRVLKPGSFAFVMSIPRADCLSRMIISLEDAGFNVGFTPIYWTMASGFPKAQNCGKVILKRFLQASLQDVSRFPGRDEGSQSDSHCHFCGGQLQSGLVIFRDAPPLSGDAPECSHLFSPSVDIQVDTEHTHKASYALLSFHHATQDLKPLASWQTIVSSVLESKPDDWLPQFSADNWGLGHRFLLPHGFGQRDSTLESSNALSESETGAQPKPDKSGMAGGNTHKSTQSHLYYNKYCPACQMQMSSEYSKLVGSYSGFQPKPAVEVIIVAMKPLSEKTFVDQALKNRKGITWLDDCRVPIDDTGAWRTGDYKTKDAYFGNSNEKPYRKDLPSGRFPANLLVSDDVLNDGKNRQAGYYKGEGSKSGGIWHQSTGKPAGKEYGDSGSFSRYFDLDKWFKTFPFLIVPKASKSEKNKGLDGIEPIQTNDGRNKLPDNAFQRGKSYRTNPHPTVKPLKLMSYLITLGSRQGDTVLDPFMGSGTTALACKLLNRKCIGIEIEERYAEIATKRCSQDVMELDI